MSNTFLVSASLFSLAQVSKNHDLETFIEASGNLDWDTAMHEEYRSLMANNNWDLVPLPKGRKLVICKWVYRTKYSPNGIVERLKARLVAKGFSQVEGIDYNETFAPITKMNSIFLVHSLAALHNWEVHQMDIKSAFYMVIYKRKFTWNNLLYMFIITLSLSVALRNP